jgi:hypothetical protein
MMNASTVLGMIDEVPFFELKSRSNRQQIQAFVCPVVNDAR